MINSGIKKIAVGLLLCAAASLPLAAAPSAREAALNGVWTLAKPMGKTLLDASGNAPPLLPAGKALYEQRRAQLAKGDTSFDLSVKCKPIGFPRVLWDGGPFDIQLQSKVVFFGYSWNRNHRTANMSDELPDLQVARYYGTSSAHWDGDTLVVESGLFNDMTLLDSSGLPHSEEMMLTERYRPTNNGKSMEVRVKITDARYYSKPWEVLATFNKVPDGRIAENVCQLTSPFYKDLIRGR